MSVFLRVPKKEKKCDYAGKEGSSEEERDPALHQDRVSVYVYA